MFRSWCRQRGWRLTASPVRAAAPAAAASRPLCLESLEDRCLFATGLSSLQVSPGGVTLVAQAGREFTALVAHLHLAGASGVRAAIDWGDGHTSDGLLQTGGGLDFDVLGSNTYQHSGTFAVSVAVNGADGLSLAVTSEAVVFGQALTNFDINVAGSTVPLSLDIANLASGAVSFDQAEFTVVSVLTGGGQVIASPPAPAPPPKPAPAAAPPGPAAPPAVAPPAGPHTVPVSLPPAAGPPRVDPTTFVIWTSQRDHGGTTAQPPPPETRTAQPAVVPTPLTAALDRAAEPARLDVAAFFNARQAATGETPGAPEARGETDRPTLTGRALGACVRDDEVMVALADAVTAPAPVPPPPTDTPAGAPGDAAGSESGNRPREKRGLARLAAAWLLAPPLLYGLWQNWGWPDPDGRRRGIA